MNVMLRYPLRHLVLGILAGFAILIGLLTYLVSRPVVMQQVEQQAAELLRAELTQLQGVLQLLLRSENLEGARSVVASLGSAPQHEFALLTDAAGTTLASTRLADIGVAWTSLDRQLNTDLIEQVETSGKAVVQSDPETQRLTGYATICSAVDAATLRPRQCGFLYQQINLSKAKAAAVATLNRQAVGYGLGLAVAAGVLGIILHSAITRRIERLIATVNLFTAGDMTARANLQGQDELGQVGDAFDAMAQTIASNQQRLEDLNRQLAQRLTERTQAEEALQRAHDELEQRVRERTAALQAANEEVRRFAYLASHDLRTPLVNLQGFAGELRASCRIIQDAMPAALPHLEADQRTEVTRSLEIDVPEALDFIEVSVSRMGRLIEAILDLSRQGRRELQVEPINLNTLVQAVVQSLGHQIAQHPAQVTIGPLPDVRADRAAMDHIMSNLLSNAVAYLNPTRPGEISVNAKRDADFTTIEVQDNGRGIAADDIPRVFELFRRVGQQTVEGDGIGLSSVQTLVRRHGGEIKCDSALDVGTTFRFTLSNRIGSTHPGEGNRHAN